MSKVITREELQVRIAANPDLLILEALPEKYYRDGHLPGAKHMPHDQTKQLAAGLAPNRESEIVVYCASNTCQNSHIAANYLTQLGYSHVAVYAGGKQDWNDAGLPFERDLAVAS